MRARFYALPARLLFVSRCLCTRRGSTRSEMTREQRVRSAGNSSTPISRVRHRDQHSRLCTARLDAARPARTRATALRSVVQLSTILSGRLTPRSRTSTNARTMPPDPASLLDADPPTPPCPGNLWTTIVLSAMTLALALASLHTTLPRVRRIPGKKTARALLLLVVAALLGISGINQISLAVRLLVTHSTPPEGWKWPYLVPLLLTTAPSPILITLATAHRVARLVVVSPALRKRFLVGTYVLCALVLVAVESLVVVDALRRDDPENWAMTLRFPAWTAAPLAVLPVLATFGSSWALEMVLGTLAGDTPPTVTELRSARPHRVESAVPERRRRPTKGRLSSTATTGMGGRRGTLPSAFRPGGRGIAGPSTSRVGNGGAAATSVSGTPNTDEIAAPSWMPPVPPAPVEAEGQRPATSTSRPGPRSTSPPRPIPLPPPPSEFPAPAPGSVPALASASYVLSPPPTTLPQVACASSTSTDSSDSATGVRAAPVMRAMRVLVLLFLGGWTAFLTVVLVDAIPARIQVAALSLLSAAFLVTETAFEWVYSVERRKERRRQQQMAAVAAEEGSVSVSGVVE
ncbi:hypothetical protein AMAG_15045 [Allomyces macrogynus ATCC 38327]|uniref:Uncharacterized protein n=1 Tax=Allomyces macrogynus (strain ATCC 38327) TaxID=578462 RepID=A0A0L0T5J0_ALLM3|nr:hypothetical protein AMAG_15045 [Allomyces macrogynus ATCC 38327]|eukprot:KNE70058.1 hypothetical protein AMAG_15045 [Allomyces macrogynus ATCC 38327]